MAGELLRALVQIKQLAEAGYEDRAKSTFKRWIGNRTPGQIGNKYASEEEKQHLCTITLAQLKKAVYQFEKAEKAQKI